MSDQPAYVPSPWKMSADHVERYLASGGTDGAEWNGIPCVILTTTGRRTGALRRTPVVRVFDGDRYLVVGSMGGAPKHPQWYFNVLDHPASRCTRADEAAKVGQPHAPTRGTPTSPQPASVPRNASGW